MAKGWVTDQKWRDIKDKDLPPWVKRRVKELAHHSLTGKSFEYRREPATGTYQRRLRRPPDNSECHRKGTTHQKLGEHKQAIACFDEAISINEMDHTAWHRKGISLNALGKYNEAIECFKRAIQINSNDHFAWNHRAVSLRELKKYDDALTSCNEAIRINEKYPYAWYIKGTILSNLGNLVGAKSAYEEALKLAPSNSNDMYRKALSEIEQSDIKEQIRKRLDQWESDGYDVSEFKNKWFKK